MKVLPRSLYAQLILLVSCILLATGAMSGWLTARQQAAMLDASMRRNAEMMTRNLGDRSAYFLVLQDFAGLDSFLMKSVGQADILRLQVCEQSGVVVGDVESNPDGTPRRKADSVRIAPPRLRGAAMLVENGGLVVWQPVEAGGLIGWIRADYSMASIRRMEATTWRNSLLLSLFWVVCSIALLLLMLRPFVRGIGRLAEFARGLDAHKGTQTTFRQGTAEIEELGASLNYASTRLYETEQDLIREREALKLSEARLRTLVQTIPDLIWLKDAEGVYLFCNTMFERFFGAKEADIVGKTDYDFVDRDQADSFRAHDRKAMEAGKPSSNEEWITFADDGHRALLDTIKTPLLDSGGKPIGVLGIARDITERKQMGEALRKSDTELKESQRLAHIGSWDWDTVNDTIWWSDEYYRIFGFDPNKPTPNYAEHRKAYTPESAERLDAAVKRATETGEPYEVDLELAQSTASTRWIVARGEAKRDASRKIWGLRGTAQNITERKLAEQEIQRTKGELEQRVRDRTADLQKKGAEIQENQSALMNIVEDLNSKTAELGRANARLQELDRLKSMFIASMSHELRTPLNSVIGFSSILLNEWLGPLTAEQKENLDIILKSGKHLLSLINDVIDVSKIEAGKIDLQVSDFDLRDLLSEAVDLLRSDMEKKGLTLSLEAVDQEMHTDRRRLLQCVINLVSNAVKFTEQGNITVRTKRVESLALGVGSKEKVSELRTQNTELHENFIEISVEDTGMGIREEDLAKLFQPFTRLVTPMQATIAGTGLGLYLTHKLATEVLKGDILCMSTYGVGSTFTIRIPARLA